MSFKQRLQRFWESFIPFVGGVMPVLGALVMVPWLYLTQNSARRSKELDRIKPVEVAMVAVSPPRTQLPPLKRPLEYEEPKDKKSLKTTVDSLIAKES